MTLLTGPPVAVAAWLLGTPWPVALAGLAVWMLAWRPGWTGRLAPPLALLLMAAAAPLPSLLSWQALAWTATALMAAVAWALPAGSIPLRGAWILPVSALLLAPILFWDWAPTFTASDVATRAQVLALAIASMLAVLVIRRQSRPSPW